MTYSFDAYLKARGDNWYDSDSHLQKILDHYCPNEHKRAKKELKELGEFTAQKMFCLSHAAAQKENEPRLIQKDPYNNEINHVELCGYTKELYKEIYSRKLGFVSANLFLHYAKLYLTSLNGEAGVCCSLACTDGMERILRKFKSGHPALEKAHKNIINPTKENFFHGAQFVTEIQGGSDAATNTLKAIKDKNAYTLYGEKWFCSNITADYFLVTARIENAPQGAKGISLFLVPHYSQHPKQGENNFSITRLKDKFGTRELATAEVIFDGATAYLIGEQNRGLSLVVSEVLVTSRIHCSLAAAALLRRAVIEIEAYCDFREAFGKKLKSYYLVKKVIDDIGLTQKQLTEGFFKLLSLWKKSESDKKAAIDFRILVSLFKTYATKKAALCLHEAMMLLGANGMEERFSVLPRLFRDAVVYETWEGPHLLLITQAYEDMKRFVADDLDGFLKRTLNDSNHILKDELNDILTEVDTQTALLKFQSFSRSFLKGYLEIK